VGTIIVKEPAALVFRVEACKMCTA